MILPLKKKKFTDQAYRDLKETLLKLLFWGPRVELCLGGRGKAVLLGSVFWP